jgi:RNA polymerase subunit RPABC4/transcription elongation factor Spt4
MSLISCPECAREVSDRAVACPHCGNPMSPTAALSMVVRAPVERAVRIEATGKRYKALQFVGAGAITLAVVSCAAGTSSSGEWSGFVFLIEAALYAYGRVGAWWNHG